MARDFFVAEGGFQIDDNEVTFLSGTGAPGGTTDTDAVVVGSFYTDDATGFSYEKVLAGSGTDRWRKLVNQDDLDAVASSTVWRAPVLVKDDTVYANLAAAEAAMNGGTVDGVAVADGDRILYTAITGENANVFVVNGTPGGGATLVEDTAPEDGYTLWVEQGATAADTLWVFDGTAWVQRGSGDQTELAFIRAFIGKSAAGSELPDYANEFFIVDGDDLETAIGKLDAQLNVVTNQVNAAHTQTTTLAVASATVIDSVLVDECAAVKWLFHAEGNLNVDADKKRAFEIYAIHNGHNNGGGADATTTDFTVFARLRDGAIGFGAGAIDVILSGAGAAQQLQLELTPGGTSVDTRVVRECVEYL